MNFFETDYEKVNCKMNFLNKKPWHRIMNFLKLDYEKVHNLIPQFVINCEKNLWKSSQLSALSLPHFVINYEKIVCFCNSVM